MIPTTNRAAGQSGFLGLYDQLKQIVRVLKSPFEIRCYECDSRAQITSESVVSTTLNAIWLRREVVCIDRGHQSSRLELRVFAEDW